MYDSLRKAFVDKIKKPFQSVKKLAATVGDHVSLHRFTYLKNVIFPAKSFVNLSLPVCFSTGASKELYIFHNSLIVRQRLFVYRKV